MALSARHQTDHIECTVARARSSGWNQLLVGGAQRNLAINAVAFYQDFYTLFAVVFGGGGPTVGIIVLTAGPITLSFASSSCSTNTTTLVCACLG